VAGIDARFIDPLSLTQVSSFSAAAKRSG
jgi:hypothetical protein